MLALDTANAPDRAKALLIDGIETQKLRSKDRVAVIARRAGLRNVQPRELHGIDSGRWIRPWQGTGRADQSGDAYPDGSPVTRVWFASPDGGTLDAQPVDFTTSTDDAGTYIA